MKRIDEKNVMQTHFKVLLYSFGAVRRTTTETDTADLLIFDLLLRKTEEKNRVCFERPGRSRRTHGHSVYLSKHCRTASTVQGTNLLGLVWDNFGRSKAVCTALFFHILKSSKPSKFGIILRTREVFPFYQQSLAVKLKFWKIRHTENRKNVRTASSRRLGQSNKMLLLLRLPSDNV